MARPRSPPSSRPSSDAEGESHESFDRRHRRIRAGAPARQQRARVPHAGAERRHRCRQPAVGARLPGRLGSRLCRHAARLRRGRRGLAAILRRARRLLGVQGAAERRLGRELRRQRGARRREHRAQPARGPERQVLLRPRDALDHGQRHLDDRSRARQLPVRARLSRRLGPELPPLVAAGSGRRRHIPLLDDGAARGELRGQGRDQRELGRELRRRRHTRRREHPVHGHGRRDRHLLVRRVDPRPVDLGRGSGAGSRRQRRVGRAAPRLARSALPHARRRGSGRDAGDAAAPHLPRRRHAR